MAAKDMRVKPYADVPFLRKSNLFLSVMQLLVPSLPPHIQTFFLQRKTLNARKVSRLKTQRETPLEGESGSTYYIWQGVGSAGGTHHTPRRDI